MEQRLRGVDIIGLIFAVLCVLEGVIALVLQPISTRLFADFGANLPWFTKVLLHPATALVAGFTPIVLMAEGVLRKRSESSLVARCAVAIVAAVGLLVGSIVALYVPIFALGDSIVP